MATITLEYDARNHIAKSFVDAFLQAGVKVGIWKTEKPTKQMNGIDKSLEDIRHGRVREIRDTKAYFKKLGVNV
ncbi:MAG: hypothetical protein EOL95_09900 [Bacteroidia bacterium]|nr:hypothetical protein [Bacteroidia bacterium]